MQMTDRNGNTDKLIPPAILPMARLKMETPTVMTMVPVTTGGKKDDIFLRSVRSSNPLRWNSHVPVHKQWFSPFAVNWKALLFWHKPDYSALWKHNAVLQRISDKFGEHADVINSQGKHIGALKETQKKDNAKLLKLISLYAELAACGVMDGISPL